MHFRGRSQVQETWMWESMRRKTPSTSLEEPHKQTQSLMRKYFGRNVVSYSARIPPWGFPFLRELYSLGLRLEHARGLKTVEGLVHGYRDDRSELRSEVLLRRPPLREVANSEFQCHGRSQRVGRSSCEREYSGTWKSAPTDSQADFVNLFGSRYIGR